VYSVPAGDPQPYSSFEKSIAPGETYVDDRMGTGLRIYLKQIKDGAVADVRVCYPNQEGRETSCGDGLDNDCDGLTDADDPDCQGGQYRRRLMEGLASVAGAFGGGGGGGGGNAARRR
jgi:hypothetical protein